MKYIYIGRQDDSEIIADYKEKFENKTLEELVESYNGQVKCGMTGVHRQALYLIPLCHFDLKITQHTYFVRTIEVNKK